MKKKYFKNAVYTSSTQLQLMNEKEIFKLFQQYQHIQVFIFSERLQRLNYTKILQLIPNIYIYILKSTIAKTKTNTKMKHLRLFFKLTDIKDKNISS